MGKPKAPPPPDYAAAAQQQGTANVNSAIASNYLNQVSQVGPYGNLTYSYSQPGSGSGYTTSEGQYIPAATATTTLTPAQQRLLDQNNQISGSLNDLAIQGIGYVGDTANNPIDQSSLPSLNTGLARTQFSGTADPTSLGVQGNYDFSGVGAMPTMDDVRGQRDQITAAYMERLAPYLAQQKNQTDSRLATQGITSGSEAWGYDQDALNRSQNDQRLGAILAGDQEQQVLFNNMLNTRQQGVNEAMSQGNFNNQAQGQQFGQNQQGLQNLNTAAQANFGQGLASSQFNNQARSQAIQEQDYFRNQPLNMLNALRSGNQVTTPTFGNVSGGAQIQAAPIYQATADSYNAQMQQYQAQLQSQGGFLSGLASLGGAGIMAVSDRRLKKNIQAIGKRLDGLMLYAYDYIWNEPAIGVMADEVARLRPEALGPTVNGFATVNYGAL